MSTDCPDSSDNSRSKQSDDGPNQTVSMSIQDFEQLQNNYEYVISANLQLSTENQQLRTEIQHMQTQLANALHTLQPLIDLNQQWIANGRGHINRIASSSSAVALDGRQSDGSNNFPDVVLQQIFSHVNDTKTLLTCRLVSTSWKSVIDNTPALMRKLTFNVIHPVVFMDLSNIVPVVRSIKFDYIRPFTHKQLDQMARKIAPTLESVTINFDKQLNNGNGYDRSKEEQIHNLVSVVLTQCATLNELSILGTIKRFMGGLIMPCNITTLTMDVRNDGSRDQTVYEEVIKGLHKLSSLSLFNSDDDNADDDFDFAPVLSPVCEHMLKYPGVIKKFTYDAPKHGGRGFWFDAASAGQKLWTKLYLIAGTHNVAINTHIIFDLGNLPVFDESYPINVNSCSTITKARYWYYPTRTTPAPAPVVLKRILCCTNLKEIQITVSDNPHDQITSPVPNELNYLWQLKNLQIISLNRKGGTISKSSFVGPMPAVLRLEVCGEVFDSTAIYSSISVYFPNLVDLTLLGTSIPEDLFISLARLEWLAKLELNDLSTLTDQIFLISQTSIGIRAIPPLASLKQLKIVRCNKLTDKCLLYVIRFISTLQLFTVERCAGITEAGFAVIADGRLNMKTTIERSVYGEHTFTLSSTGL